VPDYVVGRSPPEADNKKNDPRSDFILPVYPCLKLLSFSTSVFVKLLKVFDSLFWCPKCGLSVF
jgi:hypothetical protein